MVGNSAGSIMAAVIAAGFTAEEIQWLVASFNTAQNAPPSLTAAGINQPIPFDSFLDLPSINSIPPDVKRSTILWNILFNNVIAGLSGLPVPIPTETRALSIYSGSYPAAVK